MYIWQALGEFFFHDYAPLKYISECSILTWPVCSKTNPALHLYVPRQVLLLPVNNENKLKWYLTKQETVQGSIKASTINGVTSTEKISFMLKNITFQNIFIIKDEINNFVALTYQFEVNMYCTV